MKKFKLSSVKVNRKSIRDYAFITFGSAIMAIGIGVFLVNAKVVPGGVSGLSMAVYYLTGGSIPIGLMIWLFNIPLYLWGVKELGTQFGIRTFYGFTLSSFFIDFFRGEIPGLNFIQLQNSESIKNLQQNDFLFLILLGAAMIGIGLGIVFKFRGSTAGTDIVAAIMQKRYGVKPGMAIMVIDFFVICIAGLIIEVKDLSGERSAMTLTLYALFLLFVSGRLVDAIIDGFDYARAAYIISDKYEDIAKIIVDDMDRGATILKGIGYYKDVERNVLTTVVSLKELGKLTSIVKKIDPKAFVTVHNVHEVLGEGFRRRV
ncbi:MAG: YitT family protein [Ignavibacteria bacterium]|nr:YitT family protein [Ignavibacteria bacterium]MBT8383645.1 YitT family protein [Ignavibacteria bacterium]MBT8390764.1 YitT family protein [Ignavibacteria bacterium]NNJ53650.1 YitT family protein [Ignavibacteriaceae bacterium]NNL22352.1 YitT family protein [Ignavibacteriaceae bacterium]